MDPRDHNPYPPTNEPGRWQKTSSGTWVENPGYTGPKQPIPAGTQSQNQNGVITYGAPMTAEQGNPNADAPGAQFDRGSWMAARDSGYDEQLTGRLLAYYANTKGKGNPAATNPAVIKQMTRQPGESYNAWMQRLNATFPGIAYRSTTGQWRDAGGVIEGDKRAMAYINYDSSLDAGGLNPTQQIEKEKNDAIAATKKSIQDFINELNTPLDENHPEAQRITKIVTQQAGDMARLRGIEGPLSVSNANQQTVNAIAQREQERKGLALDALKYQDQTHLQEGQIRNAKEQQAFENQYQGWSDKTGLDEAGRGPNNGGAIGGGIGSAIGGGLGMALGSIIPGLGTALGGAIGSGIGGAIGTGVGSAASAPDTNGYSHTPPPRKGY